MKKKALIVSSANPYPIVRSGCERLILDYQWRIFSDYDVYFLLTRLNDWSPLGLYHQDEMLSGELTVERILECGFEFALFIGFKEQEFLNPIVANIPSFCLTDIHPRDDLPERLFKGIMAHRSTVPNNDILLLGACYNSDIFFKNRKSEDFILSVGRIHSDKNQLELVSDYKERIYDKYKLPLHLVGGVGDFDYFREVHNHVDNISVFSTVDYDKPHAWASWKTSREIADLCNRARIFVMGSPKESFCIALVEAIACGTTCVVNGHYWGFDENDIRPNVYGNTSEKRGSVLDVLDEALQQDIRLDGSEWVKKFSLINTKQTVLKFIRERL